MLFLPHNLMVRYRLPVAEPILFMRLLGTAYLGLSTMYAFGLTRAYRGDDVTDVVVIGLVCNGMAAAIVWRYALGGMFAGWSSFSRGFTYASGLVLTALTLGLLAVEIWYDG